MKENEDTKAQIKGFLIIYNYVWAHLCLKCYLRLHNQKTPVMHKASLDPIFNGNDVNHVDADMSWEWLAQKDDLSGKWGVTIVIGVRKVSWC